MHNVNHKATATVDFLIEGDSDWLETSIIHSGNDFETLMFAESEDFAQMVYQFFNSNGDSLVKNSFEFVTFTGDVPLSREDFLRKTF